ncbi:hypothetical protein BDV98DRAFT_568157 [Pterulicium gracile]|uniref:Uncharacterized protein n=1 Tax=Pterulicium gracile TaxID=1884261 RepID=A0A5C3QMN1_9AGAR|nr:hypothetical protein BDV98DRAFT_568157 [Pterula gracilis]
MSIPTSSSDLRPSRSAATLTLLRNIPGVYRLRRPRTLSKLCYLLLSTQALGDWALNVSKHARARRH